MIGLHRLQRRAASALFAARATALFVRPSTLCDFTPRRVVAAARVLRAGRLGPHSAPVLHAILHPRRTAIVDGERRLDWAAFDREIAAVAAGLAELGIRAGDRVAIVLPSSIEHVAVQQAVMRLGATAVQIGYRLTAAEISYILGDARPSAIVFHASRAAEVIAASGATERVLVVVGGELAAARRYSELVRDHAGAPLPAGADPRASGLMIYTSGTTGRPKGADRSLRVGGYAPVVEFMHRLGMSPVERHLVVCPLYHTGAFGFVSMMLTLGATTFLMDHFDPEAMLAMVARERLTSVFLVPTMLSRILQLGPATLARYDTRSLRWIASGAAPLSPDLARRFQEQFGNILWNFYGATETGVVTLAGPDDHDQRPGTIGRPLRGNRIRLLDDRGVDVAPGEIGELYVRNAMLVGGYHRDPDATAAAMRDGYFSVGDLARRDRDGFLYLESRKSDMIISGGINIYPREIEDRLSAHPDVLECAVVGVPDDDWGERVVAFVAPRSEAFAPDAVLRHCREHLASYKCPREIRVVGRLPRNDTGKVLKRALLKV